MTDLVLGGEAGLLVSLPVNSPQTSAAFTDWVTSNPVQKRMPPPHVISLYDWAYRGNSM